MLKETYHLGSYWSMRKEEATACAQRTELFFHMLARRDESLTAWYRAGRVARGMAGHPVNFHEREKIEELLKRGRNRTDLHKRVIEDLGFGFSVWTARPSARSTTVRIRCGVYAEMMSNYCLLYPPREGETSERMLSIPALVQMLTCMATAWDPDWGVVTSPQSRELIREEDQGTDVGWMTYFARRRGTVPPLPTPVRIEPVGTLGTLVILTPERFTASNPEHIALGRRVRALLQRSGLLQHTPA